MAIVYLLHNTVNDRLYVGKTVRALDVRWNAHVTGAKRNDNDMLICRAIKKHGAAAFERRIIEECDESIVNDREIFWIAELKTHVEHGGYNLTLGGEGRSGYKMSDESKQRIREAAVGRKHAAETKLKMSESAKKRGYDPAKIAKMVHANKMRIISVEERERRSIAQRGKCVSTETRAKIGVASRNRIVSEETRAKLRVSNKRPKGWKHTDESRASMSVKHAKPVLQYSLDGQLLGSFPSAKAAAMAIGVSATSILRSIQEQRAKLNFIWKRAAATEVQ